MFVFYKLLQEDSSLRCSAMEQVKQTDHEVSAKFLKDFFLIAWGKISRKIYLNAFFFLHYCFHETNQSKSIMSLKAWWM